MQKFSDNNIVLIEDIHRYELLDDPNFEFTSCTNFIKLFFEPFDKIGIANNLTSSHDKYSDMTPQELVEEWDKSGDEGTAIHNEIQQFINNGTEPIKEKSILAVKWIKENMTDRNILFSEVMVYSKELELAGSIDLLVYNSVTDSYKIFDWKTSKRIDINSFRNRMGNHNASSRLMDCNYIHYSLQLSLYQYILEKQYGIKIDDAEIVHIGESRITTYRYQYFKNEIENMLKTDREMLKKKAEDSLTKDYI